MRLLVNLATLLIWAALAIKDKLAGRPVMPLRSSPWNRQDPPESTP